MGHGMSHGSFENVLREFDTENGDELRRLHDGGFALVSFDFRAAACDACLAVVSVPTVTMRREAGEGTETEIKTIIGSCAASIGQQAHTLSFFGEGDCACPRCGTVLSVEQAGLWD